MPRKKRINVPRRRAERLRPSVQNHLLHGDCGLGPGCAICHPRGTVYSPCDRPLVRAAALATWQLHRTALLSRWEYGQLSPRLPTFGECYFESAPLPEHPHSSWPERVVRRWGLTGQFLCGQRAWDAYQAGDEVGHDRALELAERFADRMSARLAELEPPEACA